MQSNQAALRKRKFMLLLPVIALPFAAFLFYNMGGGTGDEQEQATPPGLNSLLPGAQLEQPNQLDKMSLYKLAEKDSAAQREAEAEDQSIVAQMNPGQLLPGGAVPQPFEDGTSHTAGQSPEMQVDALNRKLAMLQQVIDQTPDEPVTAHPTTMTGSSTPTPELQQLEKLLDKTQETGPPDDPELNKMNNMLKTIMDIQHPDMVRERIKQQSKDSRGKLYPVTSEVKVQHGDYFGPIPEQSIDTVLAHTPAFPRASAGFYGIGSGEQEQEEEGFRGIQAAVHDDQELVSGATVKIRLQQDAYIAGQLIAKGSFVYGQCSLSGERLQIEVSAIRRGNDIYPVSLSVYDFDGNIGIRVPGSISRDASKQAGDQAIQSVAMGTLDPSLGAQAAAAGIETAKTLLSKKVRMIRVTVKAGYPVLLKTADQ